MDDCVAVFDLGKTNMKVVVFDAAGKVLAERGSPNASVAPDALWPYRRLYTEGAWAFLIGALKELGGKFPIEAISISAHGAAGVLVGDEDAALPAMDYEFDIDGPVAAEYGEVRPAFEETQSPDLPRGLNLGRQVYYLQRRFPAEFAAARAFLAYPQYWSWRLSGVPATEFTSHWLAHGLVASDRTTTVEGMVDKLAGGGFSRQCATRGTRSGRSSLSWLRLRASRLAYESSAARTTRTPRSCPISYRGAIRSL